MNIKEHAKPIEALIGLTLWCVFATLVRVNEPSFLVAIMLFVGLAFLEVSANNEKKEDNALVRIRFVFYFLTITGIVRVADEYGGIEVIIKTVMLNNWVYIFSCLGAAAHTIIVLRNKYSNSKFVNKILNKSNA